MPKSFASSSGSTGIGGSTGSTDNAILRANGTGGSTVQSSLATINDSGDIAANKLVLSGTANNMLQLFPNYYIGIGAGSLLYNAEGIHDFQVGTVSQFQIDGNSTAGNTRMLIYDVDNATLERVSVGAADSGGAGFKCLRIPN